MYAAALCAGLAAANVVRFSPTPALAALACARVPCAFAVAGWWWGSRRLHALEHSVLLPRVGTAERALVETQEPPRVGRFRTRVRALVLRWGELRPHEPVLLDLPPGRAPPQGARLAVVGVLRLPRGPSHGFDEATWLRRQGVHVVLRAKEWRVVGRRGGLGGVADLLQRWLARDSYWRKHDCEQNHSFPSRRPDRLASVEPQKAQREATMLTRYLSANQTLAGASVDCEPSAISASLLS